MCVVISQEQNEIKTFQEWKLDIKPHREKMEKRELDKEYKDSDNPFRVVFVCAMWLTGFDVKSLSCLYLELLQQIFHCQLRPFLTADIQYNTATVHHQRAVSQFQCLVHVVGYHQTGNIPLCHDFSRQCQYLICRCRV